MRKNPEEILAEITNDWFLYEPLLFNIYCTHKLEENNELSVPFRTGKKRIEYNPDLLRKMGDDNIQAEFKTEIIRILLKHPYERVPENPNRAALTKASDITIKQCTPENKNLMDAKYYNFQNGLSYEEYYKKLQYICPDITLISGNSALGQLLKKIQKETGVKFEKDDYDKAAVASAMWDEDEEAANSINDQIEKARLSNQWGSLSGALQEKILANMSIPMDYRRILGQFRASIISQKRKLTRLKPNRRYDFDYMGSKYEPKTKLLVGVDVSGSIDNKDLQHFFSIINRFFCYGVESVMIAAFDVNITQFFELKKAKSTIQITGRGGTNFQEIIDYYENHNEYQGLIIFSDGYAKIPVRNKMKDIMWILTGKYEYDNAIRWIKKLKGRNRATWIPKV